MVCMVAFSGHTGYVPTSMGRGICPMDVERCMGDIVQNVYTRMVQVRPLPSVLVRHRPVTCTHGAVKYFDAGGVKVYRADDSP